MNQPSIFSLVIFAGIPSCFALYWIYRLIRELRAGHTPPPVSGYSFDYTDKITPPQKIDHRFRVNTVDPGDPVRVETKRI